MKTIVLSLLIIIGMAALASCSSEDLPDNFEPKLITGEASGITRTEAVLTGEVELHGNTDMPELSFRYGTSDQMEQTTGTLTPTDNKVQMQVAGLTPGTMYYYSLQGSNGRVNLAGNTMTFVTVPNDRPSVGVPAVLSQGPVSVIVEYEITDDGNEDITATGCYVTDVAGGNTQKVEAETEGAEGIKMRVRIGGFRQDATYEIKAYAANNEGEGVGEPLTFVTTNAVLLAEAGEFEELMGDGKYTYTSLSIAGPMNGDDLRCLRQMMGRDVDGTATPGQLAEVNLADAHIVEGGGVYGSSRYTENNVVGYGLFADCNSLTSVTLPSDAVKIEKDAFMNCTSIKTITVPASAASISPSSGCTSLAAINVSAANTAYSSIDGVLFDAGATEILWFPIGKQGDYTLPASVKSIGDYAFQGCHITRFTLPDNLTQIGQAVFFDSSVEEVVMPSNLRLIPTATFQKCSRLKTVRLGAATELISDYVFDGCPLTDLYIDAQYPPVCNSNALTSTPDFLPTCTLHVPKGRKNFYKADASWKRFGTIVEE